MRKGFQLAVTACLAMLFCAGCHTEFNRNYTTLSAELDMARQRGGQWCAPKEFAAAEAYLAAARSEADAGNHQVAQKYLSQAEPYTKTSLERCSGCRPDLDADGILDMIDQDPYRAEDYDGWKDSDGIPDPDNDGDGFLDGEDKCPNAPEDLDGFQDKDGCPDIDNDKDGVPDGRDQCPQDMEDNDGFQDDDGCPEPDNDFDNFLDGVDACPNAPETLNGFLDDDGCPDFIPKVRKIIPLPKVRFIGKSRRLPKKSMDDLKVFAERMINNPELYVRIEGYCKAFGSDESLKARTKNRAETVKQILMDFGVDEDKIITFGFGRPESPTKKTGYWTEFVIYQR